MQWLAVMSCVQVAMCLASRADPVTISSPHDKTSPHPDPAVLYNGGRPVREGALKLLHDRMNQGDALLKERLKSSIRNLKELLREEDADMKERVSEGLGRLEEQLKEADDQLKEELVEDVAWLREKLAKGQRRLKEELEGGEAKTKEELEKLKEAFEKQPHDVKQSDNAMMNYLWQQMSFFQAELKTTKLQLQTTETELKTHQQMLQSTQTTLQSFTALSTQLHAAEQEIRSLKMEMGSVQSNHDLASPKMGSTFIRWGRTTCPDNTSLVYSGYVGGQSYHLSGGGSNYLCLVMDPELDTMTLPERFNYLYGAEYENIEGQQNQDPLCSVCWAPQVSTIMIPATRSCPAGWTAQYRGHLVSTHYSHEGRNEFVCLDEIREHRQGGEENVKGAEFFHVVTECGTLPCPPYVDDRVVTCVVCSL